MNNLHRWRMSDYLPYEGFKCLKSVDNFDVNSISEKSPVGYIIKVELKYPAELYILHNYYPLGLEKLAIPYDMLSDYSDETKISSCYDKSIYLLQRFDCGCTSFCFVMMTSHLMISPS